MNFKKTRKVISKLNTLMDSFESIGEELSDIEISLLEKYIDDLKDSLPRPAVNEDTSSSQDIPTSIKSSEVTKPSLHVEEEQKVELPKQQTKPKKEDLVEASESTLEEIPEILESNIPVVDKLEEEEEEVPTVMEKIPTNAPSDQRFDALFTKVEVKELSDQLKWKPIQDIDKSLSINERILTKNELFDGDAELMNATIATLNSLKSYDEAIEYLKNNVALKLDWISDSKKGKALLFLQKVQRRYM